MPVPGQPGGRVHVCAPAHSLFCLEPHTLTAAPLSTKHDLQHSTHTAVVLPSGRRRSSCVNTTQQQQRRRPAQPQPPPAQPPRRPPLQALALRAGSVLSPSACGTRCSSGSRPRQPLGSRRCRLGPACRALVACWVKTFGCLMEACLLKRVSRQEVCCLPCARQLSMLCCWCAGRRQGLDPHATLGEPLALCANMHAKFRHAGCLSVLVHTAQVNPPLLCQTSTAASSLQDPRAVGRPRAQPCVLMSVPSRSPAWPHPHTRPV